MNPTRFDRIATLFAERRLNRRRAVQHGAAGLTAVGLTATILKSAAAQDATPVTDASPAASGEADRTELLFVQSFESGAIAPKDGADGTYTLTVQHGLGETLYFSDRPERIVGTTPTQQFLDVLGFTPENPPNAALVIGSEDGGTDIAVVELMNPTYDKASSTATYDISVLENYEREVDMQLEEAPSDLAAVASSFGTAHLFIDDCPNDTISCTAPYYGDQRQTLGSFPNQPFCYNYLLCIPCVPFEHNPPYRGAEVDYWSSQCNNTNSACNGNCTGDFTNRCALDGC
jgi:hypothetical protein